jgi:peptide-methionine (S)-S-oxide reductase
MSLKALILSACCVIPTLAFAGPAFAVSSLPDPKAEISAELQKAPQTIIFAGGCFWGVQGVFQHVKGVEDAVSGYAGGTAETANYDRVSTGTSGHAESVKVTYDPSKVSLSQLLKIYFSVAHDPTELNRQGPDKGTQYRSEIFFTSPEQGKVVESYISQLNEAKSFPKPVVTKAEALQNFYPAEGHHQNYLTEHPESMYIIVNDAPKVAQLKKDFPDLYSETPVLTKVKM